jgi:aminopeptidase-like protein
MNNAALENSHRLDPHTDAPAAETESPGQAMYRLAGELHPICRSITGDGFRRSLNILQRHIPIEMREVPSGTQVFDWTVPAEWNIRRAWVKGPDGRTVIDFRDHNLHVVNYSVPVHQRLSLGELRKHLHTIPEHPDWIPYRTSYYNRDWGFCLSHNRFRSLEAGEYEVLIDSTLENGHLTYGELFLPGDSDEEILISCHCCHPSLANDNLSGMALATFLARRLMHSPRRHGFRFLFIPGTIGAITWLARNRERAARIRHGLVTACVGDPGPVTYQKSRRGDATIDRVVEHVLRHSGLKHEILDFTPFGYDTRQYCSPGFDLPVGALMRTMHGRYPEYHTSADDMDLIRPDALGQSLDLFRQVIEILECNRRWRNTQPFCEPQLGRRGLYRAMGGMQDGGRDHAQAMMWLLNFSDGRHSLLDIADRSGLPFGLLRDVSQVLTEHELLVPCDEPSSREDNGQ